MNPLSICAATFAMAACLFLLSTATLAMPANKNAGKVDIQGTLDELDTLVNQLIVAEMARNAPDSSIEKESVDDKANSQQTETKPNELNSKNTISKQKRTPFERRRPVRGGSARAMLMQILSPLSRRYAQRRSFQTPN